MLNNETMTEDQLPATTDQVDPEMEGSLSAEALASSLSSGGVPKNFRRQADIEAFYRFVHENDLREDALGILNENRAQKESAKAVKGRVKH
jgi:hypothetical protein